MKHVEVIKKTLNPRLLVKLVVGILAVFVVQNLWFEQGVGEATWQIVRRSLDSASNFTAMVFALGLTVVVLKVIRRLSRRGGPRIGYASAVGRAVAADSQSKCVLDAGRIARHEAVHAVAVHHLGGEVTRITVRPSAEAGETLHTLPARVDNDGRTTGVDAADLHMASLVVAIAPHVDEIDRGLHQIGASKDLTAATQSAYVIQAIGTAPTDYKGALTAEGLLAEGRRRARHIIDSGADQIRSLTTLLAANPDGVSLGREILAAALRPKSLR